MSRMHFINHPMSQKDGDMPSDHATTDCECSDVLQEPLEPAVSICSHQRFSLTGLPVVHFRENSAESESTGRREHPDEADIPIDEADQVPLLECRGQQPRSIDQEPAVDSLPGSGYLRYETRISFVRSILRM